MNGGTSNANIPSIASVINAGIGRCWQVYNDRLQQCRFLLPL